MGCIVLITCSECKKEISNKAKSCPHCGAPLSSGQKTASGAGSFLRQYFSWIVIFIVALFVLITKPTSADFEAKLHNDIILSLAKQQISDQDTIVSGLIKLGCSLSKEECARLIRKQMTVETKDYFIALSARVQHSTETTKCIGAVGNWWCSRSKVEAE